jgi:hypothetical protein
MSTRKSDTATTVAAIVGIVVIEIAALATGHNGTMLRLSLVAIAGLGGFSLARIFTEPRPPRPPSTDDFLNNQPH